jgi:hypothetical protein
MPYSSVFLVLLDSRITAPEAETSSIRPLFHQRKTPRVKAHVTVAFPGYALWVTLKHPLKRRASANP